MLQFGTPTRKPATRRRAYRFFDLALILLTFALALPAGAFAYVSAGGAAWSTHGSASRADLYGVAFSDVAHGWAVGDGGVILATTDGGATWVKQSAGTTVSLNAVAFPDATHGWVVGSSGTILATTDGGGAWSKQRSGSAAHLQGVAFSDATHGWAVGYSGAILATTDGGGAWGTQTSGSSANLLAVTFIDATHGWAVGGGAIFATTDGGATWTTQNQGSNAPQITKLKPAFGKRGATVTISGTDFGAAQGAGAVKFGAAKCTTYVSWSDTQIKCKAPAKARYGKVKVTVTTSAGTSNGVSFTVKK